MSGDDFSDYWESRLQEKVGSGRMKKEKAVEFWEVVCAVVNEVEGARKAVEDANKSDDGIDDRTIYPESRGTPSVFSQLPEYTPPISPSVRAKRAKDKSKAKAQTDAERVAPIEEEGKEGDDEERDWDGSTINPSDFETPLKKSTGKGHSLNGSGSNKLPPQWPVVPRDCIPGVPYGDPYLTRGFHGHSKLNRLYPYTDMNVQMYEYEAKTGKKDLEWMGNPRSLAILEKKGFVSPPF